VSSKRSIQKSFVDPGNPLKIYSNLVNNGRINFNDGQAHQLRYIITDAKGNSSVLPFAVNAGSAPIVNPGIATGTILPYNKVNEFNTDEVKLVFPKGTLYSDLNFNYKKLPKPAGSNSWSNLHQVHNRFTPLHIGFDLWIKADALPENLRDKALIANANGSSQGGSFDNGFVKATPKNFGSFYIAVDTIAPRIVPLNIAEGKSMAGLPKMTFRISDNLSGIKSFNGFLDGKWILMEFDTKSATLWHNFDERTTPGRHTLELVVSDIKNNEKKYTISFFR
jgi:hypothetical protein